MLAMDKASYSPSRSALLSIRSLSGKVSSVRMHIKNRDICYLLGISDDALK